MISGPEGDSPRHRPAGPAGDAAEDPPREREAARRSPAAWAADEDPAQGPDAVTRPPEPSSAQTDSAADEAAAEEVEHDLDALLTERNEYLELAQRTRADFENYRKRMAAETAAALQRGKLEVIREVVPVLDDLERAIEAAGLDPEGDSPDGLAHGVLLVFRSLREALSRNGIEPVDPKGEKFDPQLHEALSTQPAEDTETGTVLEVMQKGYLYGEQLVRPARVVVAE